MALQIRGGELIVRAPLRMVKGDIDRFVSENKPWIEKHLAEAAERERQNENIAPLSAAEIEALANEALQVIPERVKHYAALLGVTYGKITVRNQKTRWGSCSSKGNLNFNVALMLAPGEVLDSVIVHELCHRKEMNHSARFYGEVLRVFPEYKRWHGWLRENGAYLMAKIGRAN